VPPVPPHAARSRGRSRGRSRTVIKTAARRMAPPGLGRLLVPVGDLAIGYAARAASVSGAKVSPWCTFPAHAIRRSPSTT
jgi:hypothetical protein